MTKGERLYTLDAMRGIAAILVVLYHLGDMAFRIVPGGYLAVDFFFALSGLVIAKAYERRLREGMTTGRFMTDRFIRLWPMFILGVGFAVVKAIGQIAVHDDLALPPVALATALATEILMLPSPVTGVDLFPLNGPAWSLFFELAINAAFALLLFKMRRHWLVVLSALGAAIVMWTAFTAGSMNIGWSWATSFGGLGRVIVAFTLGVLIHRVGIAAPVRKGWLMVLPIIILVALMALPIAPAWRVPFDLIVALIAAPVLLVLGGRWQAPPALEWLCKVLGDLSYPLYAVHFPLLFMAGFVARKLHLAPIVWIPAFIVGLAGFAFVLGRWVDPAIRRLLVKLTTSKRLSPAIYRV